MLRLEVRTRGLAAGCCTADELITELVNYFARYTLIDSLQFCKLMLLL